MTWLLYFGRMTVEYPGGGASRLLPASMSRTRSPCWARASATAFSSVRLWELTLAETIRNPRSGAGVDCGRHGPDTATVAATRHDTAPAISSVWRRRTTANTAAASATTRSRTGRPVASRLKTNPRSRTANHAHGANAATAATIHRRLAIGAASQIGQAILRYFLTARGQKTTSI